MAKCFFSGVKTVFAAWVCSGLVDVVFHAEKFVAGMIRIFVEIFFYVLLAIKLPAAHATGGAHLIAGLLRLSLSGNGCSI